jgi:hypothetical protein
MSTAYEIKATVMTGEQCIFNLHYFIYNKDTQQTRVPVNTFVMNDRPESPWLPVTAVGAHIITYARLLP